MCERVQTAIRPLATQTLLICTVRNCLCLQDLIVIVVVVVANSKSIQWLYWSVVMMDDSGWMRNALNPNEFCFPLCMEYLINNNHICGMIANHKLTIRMSTFPPPLLLPSMSSSSLSGTLLQYNQNETIYKIIFWMQLEEFTINFDFRYMLMNWVCVRQFDFRLSILFTYYFSTNQQYTQLHELKLLNIDTVTASMRADYLLFHSSRYYWNLNIKICNSYVDPGGQSNKKCFIVHTNWLIFRISISYKNKKALLL